MRPCFAVSAGVVRWRPRMRTDRPRRFVLRVRRRSRTIVLPDGKRVPRVLRTVVRYPSAAGLRPLIVFAHGGAMLGGMGSFPRRGPPLLAVRGTADTLNAPAATATFFGLAPRPKFLLWLVGASHLPPCTDEQPQLGIVERTTIAFLDHYEKGRPLAVFERTARVPGLTRLVAEP